MDLLVPCIVEGSSELLKHQSRDMLETQISSKYFCYCEDCGTPHPPNEGVALQFAYSLTLWDGTAACSTECSLHILRYKLTKHNANLKI